MSMRGNDQQAYDRGTSLFSPDGRIYQVEYAREAVTRGAPSVGVRAADGVVLAALTRASSELMEAESVEKLHKLDDHVAAASAGHVADARRLVDFARRQTQVNRLRFGEPIDIESLTKAVTDNIQENTQRGGTRPYGAALLVGGVDPDGRPRLYGADPSGTPHEWKATVIGGGRQEIQDALEEGWREGLSVEEAVELAVEVLVSYAEDLSPGEVSVASVTAEGYRHYPTGEVADAVAAATEDEDVAGEDETEDNGAADAGGPTGEDDADADPDGDA